MKKITILLICAALALTGVLSVLHFRSNADNSQPDAYDLGLRFLKDGKYEEAVVMFSSAIEVDDRNSMAYFYRAQAYLSMADNCLDPETCLEYLDQAEKDFIQAEILDSSITADVEKHLETLEKLREESAAAHSPTTVPEETEPEETEPETTAETTEETVPPESTTPKNNAASNNSTTTPGSNSPAHNPTVAPDTSNPSHNPTVPPVDDDSFMPDDEPAVSIPPVPDDTDEPASNPNDNPSVDYGEPPIVDIGSPDTGSGSTPSHNPDPTPSDDPVIDNGEPPVVDLGSPDTSDTSHSDQVLPED